jgi:hypothetical protein
MTYAQVVVLLLFAMQKFFLKIQTYEVYEITSPHFLPSPLKVKTLDYYTDEVSITKLVYILLNQWWYLILCTALVLLHPH